MVSLVLNDGYVAPLASRPMPVIDFGYQPSDMQMAFYRWLHDGTGSANLIAVAGSGKSTSIRGGLCYIPEEAYVTVLAFNSPVAKEMKEKIKELGAAVGREFRRVEAKTFHSLGWSAVLRRLGVKWNDRRIELTGGKSRKILREKLSHEEYRMYGAFCAKLVSFAKGEGLGVLRDATREAFLGLINQHGMRLDNEEADLEKALEVATRLLDYSIKVAEKRLLFDFDDQIYLPVLWGLTIWQNDFLFIDEAQDTNPCRRALAAMALKPGGRLVAVGDPHQAIYGFTGANHDAMDLIKEEFGCVELPLTVSYRCPKAAEELVRHMVPHFSVAPSAPAGSVLHLSVKEGLARLSQRDAVICRNTAPLIDLAFTLMDEGRPCIILGRDVGASLIAMVEAQDAIDLNDLETKLERHAFKECAKLIKNNEDEKADALQDRVGSVLRIARGLRGGQANVAGLLRKLESLFSDVAGPALTLCTGHKAKGMEWDRVALLEPSLMPSAWAKTDEQYQQEKNLMYVVRTRFKEEFIFLDGVDAPKEPPATAGEYLKQAQDDLDIPPFLKRT